MNPAAESPASRDPEKGETEVAERPSYRSVARVGILTLLSRALGLLREATRAHFLGTGLPADAFQVAFVLPNLLRRLVGEGAVSSVLVPVFSQFAKKGNPREQRVLAEKFLTLWLVLVLVVTAAGILFGGYFVRVCFRWGTFAETLKIGLTAQLTTFLFGYLFFVGMAAALGGILNARKYFAVPSISPLLFNVGFIVCAWVVAPGLREDLKVFALAGAVLVGGLLQLAILLPWIWRIGIRPRPRWPLDHPAVRQVLRLFLPAIFGAGVYQINVLVNTLLASRLETEGSVAVLSYSNRLMEVVLGVYVFALSTVSLTSLSRQAVDRDLRGFSETLLEVLRLVLFITIPSMVGLYLLRRPILSLLLQSGAFDVASLEMTARAFQFHVLGLSCVGISRVMVNGFYAMKDLVTPVRIASLILMINLGLAWVLSESELSYAGIALASSIAALFQAVMLWRGLTARIPELDLRPLWPTALKASVAALLMGGGVWGGSLLVSLEHGKLLLGLELSLVILGGAAIYFLLARVFRMAELAVLFRRRKN